MDTVVNKRSTVRIDLSRVQYFGAATAGIGTLYYGIAQVKCLPLTGSAMVAECRTLERPTAGEDSRIFSKCLTIGTITILSVRGVGGGR